MNDLIDRTVHEVSQGRVFALLPDDIQDRIRALPEHEVRAAAIRGITRPQPGDTAQSARLLLNPCLTIQWLSAFEELGLPRNLQVFEPCTGSSEPVIYAAEIYSDGEGSYTSLNLNRPLAAELRAKLAKLRMKIRIIEDDASRDALPVPPASIDIACFHHAINDILQTAVSEPRGMDTRTVDWWANERQMIQWLAEDYRAGKLDERARPALVQAVKNAVAMVKPGGCLLFDHWTWEAGRNSDYLPWDLFCDLIPLARRWIEEERLPVDEQPLKGRDPQWWMCLRVVSG